MNRTDRFHYWSLALFVTHYITGSVEMKYDALFILVANYVCFIYGTHELMARPFPTKNTRAAHTRIARVFHCVPVKGLCHLHRTGVILTQI